MTRRDLAPGEWAVLALLCEKPAHGWALARDLSASGELGSIWALGRPLVYRALDALVDRGLIEQAAYERGVRGPNRTVYRATESGQAAVVDWLGYPVDHVREGRSLLLLKIVFAERSRIDPRPLLRAQAKAVAHTVSSLEQRLADTVGTEAILMRFRLESTRAVLRFVEAILLEREQGVWPSGPAGPSVLAASIVTLTL